LQKIWTAFDENARGARSVEGNRRGTNLLLRAICGDVGLGGGEFGLGRSVAGPAPASRGQRARRIDRAYVDGDLVERVCKMGDAGSHQQYVFGGRRRSVECLGD